MHWPETKAEVWMKAGLYADSFWTNDAGNVRAGSSLITSGMTVTQLVFVAHRWQDLIVTGSMCAGTQQLARCGIDEVPSFHHHMVHVGLVKPVVDQGLI